MMDSMLVGTDHLTRRDPPTYFTIGQIDPAKGYVHVFDDATLDIVMNTLDTTPDFIAYLLKKESFLTRGHAVIAAGEEELLANYLQQLNGEDEHDFVLPKNVGALFLDEGHWDEFRCHPQRIAQIEANRVSYLWDELIEKFSGHIMNGTQQYTSTSGPNESEIPLRFLAAENRTRRRMLAQGLLNVVNKANATNRFVRIYQSLSPREPYYVLLSIASTHAKSEEQYREVRRGLLEAYILVCKLMHPDAKDIVGIALSPSCELGCSEDLLYFDAREWTPEIEAEARLLQNDLRILKDVKPTYGKYNEYPQVPTRRAHFIPPGRFPRNAPCGCGSGLKFKKCCGRRRSP